MALATGTRLGAYEIVGLLGAGGMGEVYRARDGKLNRDIALKIVPDAFTNDPDRLARFKREAHVLASLNHPNIAAIYGFEDSNSIALAPDGRNMAFVATTQGTDQLWVGSFDGTPARPLAGTNGAQYPFWSPDSRALGFFAGNKLQVVDVDGGQPRPLANVLTPAGGTWNATGTILFVPKSAGSVFAVPAEGGTAAPNGQIANEARGQRFPHFLPDGRHFLVHAGAGQSYGLYVGELGSGEMRRL